MYMVKREGESGHFCLIPLCSVKFDDVYLLIVTLGELCSVMTQLINDSPNPNFCRVANKNGQLMHSKAFSASYEAIVISSLF